VIYLSVISLGTAHQESLSPDERNLVIDQSRMSGKIEKTGNVLSRFESQGFRK
jgi:hypothetical protein